MKTFKQKKPLAQSVSKNKIRPQSSLQLVPSAQKRRESSANQMKLASNTKKNVKDEENRVSQTQSSINTIQTDEKQFFSQIPKNEEYFMQEEPQRNVSPSQRKMVSSSLAALPKNKIQQKTINLNLNSSKTPLKNKAPRNDLQLSQSSKQLGLASQLDQIKIQDVEQQPKKEVQFMDVVDNNEVKESEIQVNQKENQNPLMQNDVNNKVDQLLVKYKNTSFFNQKQSYESTPTNVNQYVTRISRPLQVQKLNVNQQTTSQKASQSLKSSQRKRMNSPIHSTKQNSQRSKENQCTFASVYSSRKIGEKSTSSKQQAVNKSTQVNLFQNPYNDFKYYMNQLEYFHLENKVLKPKIQKMYNSKLSLLKYFDDIYKEHFVQNYHALQFCKEIDYPNIDQIKNKIVKLPPLDKKKYKRTIVFDLDETLVHCNESNDTPAHVTLPIKFPTGETVNAGINIRPYCKELLQELAKDNEIIIFTASHECYASQVLNYLDPTKKLIAHKFFRESCVVVQDNLHIKDLRVIGNRDLNDLLIVDNASYSFYFQLQNGIPIIPYYDNEDDKELIYLYLYLNQLESVSQNFSYFQMSKYLSEDSPEEALVSLF